MRVFTCDCPLRACVWAVAQCLKKESTVYCGVYVRLLLHVCTMTVAVTADLVLFFLLLLHAISKYAVESKIRWDALKIVLFRVALGSHTHSQRIRKRRNIFLSGFV